MRTIRQFVPLLVLSLVFSALVLASGTPVAAQTGADDARWFQIDTEVLRSAAPHGTNADAFAAAYVDVIATANDRDGYNGVVLRGAEINVLGASDRGRDSQWVARVQQITAAARAADMAVVMSFGSIGRCGRMLDTNNAKDLAAAYPVTMQMNVTNGLLTSAVAIDASETLNGRTIVGNGNQRAVISGLEKGGHYRVGVSLQGANVNAGQIRLRVVDTTTGQILNALQWAKPSNPADTRIVMAFNSFASTEVRVEVETSDRAGQTLSLGGYSVGSVPTLNGVSRDGKIGNNPALAVKVLVNGQVTRTLTLGDGLSYGTQNGSLIPRDPQLGTWDSNVNSWSARHTPPALQIDQSRLPASWDQLRLEGWHALPYKKVVSCSWNDPALSQLIGRVASYAQWLGGTASLLPFDEINTGGTEPADGRGNNTSQAMTNSIANAVGAVRQAVGGGPPVYIFSDMIDKNTNARPCYEHVVGSLANPKPVPTGVTVLTWDESGTGGQHFIRSDDTCFPRRSTQIPNFSISAHRAEGLTNISRLASQQIIAAYYDTDLVARDRADWQEAVQQSGVTDVTGVLYAAWEPPGKCPAYPDGRIPDPNDPRDAYGCVRVPCRTNLESEGCTFEHLTEFADLWWDDEDDFEPMVEVDVNGTSATVTWNLPNDSGLTGTWLGLDGVGVWERAPTTSRTYDDLAPGNHTIAVYATFAAGQDPLFLGTRTFTVVDGDSGGWTPNLDVVVTGTTATVTWSGLNAPDVNGTWIGLDGAGTWYRTGVTSATFPNLSPGEHTVLGYATRSGGEVPIRFGMKTFTVGGGISPIDVSVDGASATVSWSLPTDPSVTGTWVGLDGEGQWFRKGTETFTANDLTLGDHLFLVYATFTDRAPLRLGLEQFRVSGDDDPNLDVAVLGRTLVADWVFPADDLINGSWVVLDGEGQWLRLPTATVTWANVTAGQHTVQVFGTRGPGNEPVLIGTQTVTVQ